MEIFDNVKNNKKDTKAVEASNNYLKEDYGQSTKTMLKTKYDEGKNRKFFKAKIKSEESGHILDNHTSSSTDLENQSFTSIELRRLKKVNERSKRLVFQYIWELPKVEDIMDLHPDIVCTIEAKFRAPSCFCVFKDKKLRDLAVLKLDGLRFRNGYISVDSRGKMVPVDTSNLDITRELRTLAVHGIGREVNPSDLRKAFPHAKDVKIAQRGGSAFLTYNDDKACSQAFLEAEDTRVQGYRVQVLFGHVIAKHVKRKPSYGSSFSLKPSFKNNDHSFAASPRVATKKESLPSTGTTSKPEFRSLLSALEGSGLKMDELKSDYMRGRCEPGSGPDIRTAWMDSLKVNTNMSRSDILDLVDHVWNFIEREDINRQQCLRMEKKHGEKEGTRRSRSREKSMWLGRDDESWKGRTYEKRKNSFSPKRKIKRSWENSQEKRVHKSGESKCVPGMKMHRSWGNERSKERDERSTNSSHHKSDSRISSLKQIKLEYDSSSHSPQRVQKIVNYDNMDRRNEEILKKLDHKTNEEVSPRKRKLKLTSRSSSRSNSIDDGKASPKKSCFQGNVLPKQSKKLKKKRVSDLKQGSKNYKTEMIVSKTKMMKKLPEKSVDLKSGMKVIDKVLKKYKLVKEKGKIKQKEKEQTKKEGMVKYKEEYLPLTNNIKTELDHNGFISNASLAVDQIIDSFLQQGLRYKDLEHEYLRHLTKSTHSGKLREKLASLLSGAGFKNSSGIGPNLAAGLTLEYFHSNRTTQTKLVKWRQSSSIMEKKLDKPNEKVETRCSNPVNPPSHKKSIPNKVLEVSEGFQRMALVMAGRLLNTSQMDEESCKTTTAAMVEVWIKYGFTYNELADIYASERDRECDANPVGVSLLGMRRLLHSRLRKKVKEGHEKPRKFGFSLLIDLTMFYFEKNT